MRGEQCVVRGMTGAVLCGQTGCYGLESGPWFTQMFSHNFTLGEQHSDVGQVVLVHLNTTTRMEK